MDPAAAAAAAAAAGGAPDTEDDDSASKAKDKGNVVDADFEVVDEDKS